MFKVPVIQKTLSVQRKVSDMLRQPPEKRSPKIRVSAITSNKITDLLLKHSIYSGEKYTQYKAFLVERNKIYINEIFKDLDLD